MAGILDIKQGGKIRANFPTAVGQTWLRGQVLVVNSVGALERLSTTNITSAQSAGLALEQCVAPGTGNSANVIQNTNVVLAGQVGSILLGEATIVTDNISGTGGWIPGSTKVYGEPSSGNLTYTPTTNLSGLGTCIGSPASNGKLTFVFRAP